MEENPAGLGEPGDHAAVGRLDAEWTGDCVAQELSEEKAESTSTVEKRLYLPG